VILSEGTPSESEAGRSPRLLSRRADRYIEIRSPSGTNICADAAAHAPLPALRLTGDKRKQYVSPRGVTVIKYGKSRVEVTGDIQARRNLGHGAGLRG